MKLRVKTSLAFSCVFQNVNSVNVEPQPGTSMAEFDEAESTNSQSAEGKHRAPRCLERWNIIGEYGAIRAYMLPAAISETVGSSGTIQLFV